MNLLRLDASPDGAVIAGTDGPAFFSVEHANAMLGVRPEHIEIGFERGVRAGVESVEYLGGDSLIVCRVGAERVAVRVAGSVGLSRGESTWLRWAPGAQHYFDASGKRREARDRQASATMFA